MQNTCSLSKRMNERPVQPENMEERNHREGTEMTSAPLIMTNTEYSRIH